MRTARTSTSGESLAPTQGYRPLTTYYLPTTLTLPVLIIFSADHIERFNNAWQKESETESNDLRQNGRNIWDEFKKVQILGSGAFGAVVLSQKSSQPDQEKVNLPPLVAHLASISPLPMRR